MEKTDLAALLVRKLRALDHPEVTEVQDLLNEEGKRDAFDAVKVTFANQDEGYVGIY